MFENGDEIFSWEGEYVCSDCFDALFDELPRPERARLIGSEVTTPEELSLPPS